MATMPSCTDAVSSLPSRVNAVSDGSDPTNDLVSWDNRESTTKCIVLGKNIRVADSASLDLD